MHLLGGVLDRLVLQATKLRQAMRWRTVPPAIPQGVSALMREGVFDIERATVVGAPVSKRHNLLLARQKCLASRHGPWISSSRQTTAWQALP